jgi:hypothetical protein
MRLGVSHTFIIEAGGIDGSRDDNVSRLYAREYWMPRREGVVVGFVLYRMDRGGNNSGENYENRELFH